MGSKDRRRSQRRAQKKAQRRAQKRSRKRPSGSGSSSYQGLRAPSAVPGQMAFEGLGLFDQQEAAAIAAMMTEGAESFADRYGEVLASTDQLLAEPEFDDFAVPPQLLDGFLSDADAHQMVTAEMESLDVKAKPHLSMAGVLVADPGFCRDLLQRLEGFLARVQGDDDHHESWLSGVALKFLLEQPTSPESAHLASLCSFLTTLSARALTSQES